MQSARESGHVEILMPCQTMDPAKGSFMVHALAVKVNGKIKMVANPHWDPQDLDSPKKITVFRAGHHIEHDSKGNIRPEPHPECFDFAVDYGRRVL